MPKRGRSASRTRATKRARTAKPAFRKRSRMTPKVMLAMARGAVLRAAETKYITTTTENAQLTHNGGVGPVYVALTNMLGTAQGTTQNTRLGDEVWPKGLSIKIWLSNKLDRPNVMYRVIVFTAPPDQITSLSPAGLFQNVIANKMIDYFNTDRYSIKYERMIQPFSGDYSLESGATNKEHSKSLKIWIPLTGKLTYTTDTGNIPKYQKHILQLAIVAYDAFGTLLTDVIASHTTVARFYFKDL